MIKEAVYTVPLRRAIVPRFKNPVLDAVMPAPPPAPPRPKPRPRKVLDAYPQPAELEEEHGGDEGLYAVLEKVTKGNVTARLKQIKFDPEGGDEAHALDAWVKLCNEEAAAKKAIKDAEAALHGKALAKYPTLSKDEVKTLVVDDKWLGSRRHPPLRDGPY